jgi:hypothetical protein
MHNADAVFAAPRHVDLVQGRTAGSVLAVDMTSDSVLCQTDTTELPTNQVKTPPHQVAV